MASRRTITSSDLLRISAALATLLFPMSARVALAEYAINPHHHHHSGAPPPGSFAGNPAYGNTILTVNNFNNALQSATANPFDPARRQALQDATQGLRNSVSALNSQFSSGAINGADSTAVQGSLAGMVKQIKDSSYSSPDGLTGTSVKSSGGFDGAEALPVSSTQVFNTEIKTFDSVVFTSPQDAAVNGSGDKLIPLPGIPQVPAAVPTPPTASPDSSATTSSAQVPSMIMGLALNQAESASAPGEDKTVAVAAPPPSRERDLLGPAFGAGVESADPAKKGDGKELSSEDLLDSLTELQNRPDAAKPDLPGVGMATKAADAKKAAATGTHKKDPFSLSAGEKRRARKSSLFPGHWFGRKRSVAEGVQPALASLDDDADDDDDGALRRFLWIASLVINLTLFTVKGVPWLRGLRKGETPAAAATVASAPPPLKTTWIR